MISKITTSKKLPFFSDNITFILYQLNLGMTSSSSFAQLDGIEFKVSDLVQIKPLTFEPLNLSIRDPTEILLSSEHDFSTERQVLKWVDFKHHRATIKRPKKAVNEEMRQELEHKLRSFVKTQKKNDAASASNQHDYFNLPTVVTTTETLPQYSSTQDLSLSTDTLSTYTAIDSTYSMASASVNSTSPHSLSYNSNRSSPLQTNDIDVPPPIPPRLEHHRLRPNGNISMSVNDTTMVSGISTNTYSSQNVFNQQIHGNNYFPNATATQIPNIAQLVPPHNPYVTRSYSPSNPFLADLKNSNILLPQPVTTPRTLQAKNESDSSKIWVDFENRDMDPFTNLELKSLDDMQELSRVLQSPNQGTSSVNNIGAVSGSLNHSSSNPSINSMTQNSQFNNFVNITGT